MPNPGGSAASRSIEIESRRICDQNFLSHVLVGSEFREQIDEISVVRCVSRRKVVRVGPVGTPDDALGGGGNDRTRERNDFDEGQAVVIVNQRVADFVGAADFDPY